jgi:exoribonuclease R
MKYKLKVEDRNYETWTTHDPHSLESAEISLDPVQEKLFDQDIFEYDNKKATLCHSSVRQMTNIPGVLVLSGNKTYGSSKKGTYFYKCIPDDRRLPIFIISHRVKIEFQKNQVNKYIIFKFLHWKEKHPKGMIVQVLGTVDKLDSFYEYQLYCKSLYASIQTFTKKTMFALKNRSEQYYIDMILKKYSIEDRRDREIITIDPSNSKDYDDAFGITSLNAGSVCVSIYISNVSLWMDIMDIWSSFSQRIATIYLPDRRRPMLPTILSDALCSLQEKCSRFAFTLDIYINRDTYEIERTEYTNTCICVERNFGYEDKELNDNKTYQTALELINGLNKVRKYVEKVNDSHDVIAYLMILMNFLSAQELQKHKTGLFRSVVMRQQENMPEHIPDSVKKFLKGWMSSGGKYVSYENIEGHALLDMKAYVHITSPIRRLVDLLNMLNLQDILGICTYSSASRIFYDKWTNSLEYINRTMRSIRKVQNDSSLLHMCFNNPDRLKKQYSGFVFERIERNDGLYQYLVYLPDLKIMNRITTRHSLTNRAMYNFKIYLFMDEDRLKQKIRLEYIESS